MTWGLVFFVLSAVVLPLRLLGPFELVLWALIFWDGRLPLLQLQKRGQTHRAPERSPESSAPLARVPPLPLALRAFLLSTTLLLVAFLVRAPVIGDVPGISAIAAVSKAVLGQAPLGYGIGTINVFNSDDMTI